jgi:trehalose 6-phosphate phosphatase
VEQRHEQFERLGVTVEDKRYSLSLHYRNAVRRDQAARIIRRAVEDLRPAPKMIRGKCVINLLPCRAPHKGEALLELMKKLNRSVALYIGDDDTDEDVFDLGDRRILTVRVGRKRSSAAKFFLRRQTEITAVLRYLVERWDASKKAVSGIRETGKLPVTASLPTLS